MVNNLKNTFTKEERLSWKRHIDLLFEKGQSFIAFPLRVIFLPCSEEHPVPASILVSVSKRKFKRAVKRNRVKRQIREAYRLNKHDLINHLAATDKTIFLAFLYLDNEIKPYSNVEKAMKKALKVLQEKYV